MVQWNYIIHFHIRGSFFNNLLHHFLEKSVGYVDVTRYPLTKYYYIIGRVYFIYSLFLLLVVNNTNDDYIENIRDLFSILDYEPVLIKSGFDNNYLEYISNGNDSLSLNEYLELIKPYLNDLINVYKTKGEWKLQISAEISFVSQKPGSDETRTMFTRSTPEEFMIGSETEDVA